MGLLTKGFILLVGLFALAISFWPLWVSCFGYLAYRLWSAARKRKIYVMDKTGGEARPPRPEGRRFKGRYVLAGLFFGLSLVAFAERGALSPYVFLALGLTVVLSGTLRLGPRLSSVRPVPDSILLRGKWFPLSWASLVEVKFGTSQMARALSGIGCEMFLATDSDRVAVYLPVRVIALSVRSADRKVVEKLAPVSRALSARGAFVLPFDQKEAATRLAWSLKAVDLALEYGRNGVVSLNSTPFDVLALKPEGHLLNSAAGYIRRPDARGEAMLPSPGPKLKSQPLLWEALEVVGEKFQPKEADAYTSFLSSICATQGEGLGERLASEGRDDSGTINVSSLGAAQVWLTRPQLRAIVRIYG